MNRSARCCTPTATIASRALAQSTSEPEPHREMYGVRPISTNSRTENGNAGDHVLRHHRDEPGRLAPTEWERIDRQADRDGGGLQGPGRDRTSVVFPHPFGPTSPTTSPPPTGGRRRAAPRIDP